MSKKFIERLKEGPVKNWYIKNVDMKILKEIVEDVENRGYVLNENSGLFLRPHYDEETTKRLGFTIIDIVFARPSDHHVHPRMGEAIRVLRGNGVVLLGGASAYPKELREGNSLYIPSMLSHAFRPDREGFLEIEVACKTIYDDTQEEIITPFDKFGPWKDYFKS